MNLAQIKTALSNAAGEVVRILSPNGRINAKGKREGFHANLQYNADAFKTDMDKIIGFVHKQGYHAICKAPISGMENFSIAPMATPRGAPKGKQTLINARNAMARYHVNVVQKGELASRYAAQGTYVVLNTLLAGILGVGGCFQPGVLVGSSIALAIAFLARAVTLVATQVIGHVLPYVIALAAAAAAAGGLTLAAIKVSPFLTPVIIIAAVGIALYAEARFRIAKVESQLDQLVKKQAEDARKAARARAAAQPSMKRTAAKIVAGLAVAALATYATGSYTAGMAANGIAHHAMNQIF